MRNMLLEKLLLTARPEEEVPKAIVRKANQLTDLYIANFIMLPDKGGYKVRVLVYNRFVNLLLRGSIILETQSCNLFITTEMETAIYRQYQLRAAEAEEYVIAFLSYRVANFVHAKFHPLPEYHKLCDIILELYMALFQAIDRHTRLDIRIPGAYLDCLFVRQMWETLRMDCPLSMDRDKYCTIRCIRKTLGDSIYTLTPEEIVEAFRLQGRRVTRTEAEAAQRTYISLDADRAGEGMWELQHLLPYYDDFSEMQEAEVQARTLELARKMEMSMTMATVLLVIASLREYYDMASRQAVLGRRRIAEAARVLDIRPRIYVMVMFCFATSVKEVGPE